MGLIMRWPMNHGWQTLAVVGMTCLVQVRAPSQIRNIQVNDPFSIDPEEVTLAINPTNPLNLVAGANIRYSYSTADGGLTWTQSQLPATTWGDPSVIFDANGNAYYAHLSVKSYFIDRLIIHRSTNGGMSWKDSVEVAYMPPKNQDKEWLAADLTTSPYRNNLYMAWTQFDRYASRSTADSSRILFVRSTDGGTTWSPPVRISDRAGDCVDSSNTVEGAVPAVGPDGEVYVSWSGPLGIMFDRSLDGGRTFGQDILAADQPGGWTFDIPGVSRCNGFPTTACDVSNSPYRGRIYIGWTDQRNGPDNTDVFCISSTDGGATWGPTKKVNTDVGVAQQFFSWMTVDPATGHVYFVFYDRRNTPGDTTDVFVARSTDGGQSFSNLKVSESPFVPVKPVFFGDYTNIAALGGRIYPFWMRMDSTKLSLWIAPLADSVFTEVGRTPLLPDRVVLFQNYPNPFNPRTTITFELPAVSRATMKVFDLMGREIATLVDAPLSPGMHEAVFDGRALASGVYFCRLQVSGHTYQQAMVLLR